ncbi:MAG: PTS sugar transporter subunit IIC/EAL domain-containing protein [Treponema sp.]|nr:PTS sugar transporter subunit IIC/EAL domain-containing protein [Treponema sp.]
MNLLKKLESSKIVQAVKCGLVMILPIVLIGCFALAFRTLPINIYQKLLSGVFSSTLVPIFEFINSATFGLFSVYLVIAISWCYIQNWSKEIIYISAFPLVAVVCFSITIGVGKSMVYEDLLGIKGTFSAIFSALISTRLFVLFSMMIKKPLKIYADGTDFAFNNSISVIFPAFVTIVVFTVFNLLFMNIFRVDSFHHFSTTMFVRVFNKLGTSIFSGLLFIFVSSLLWFMGIHGNNVLDDVVSQHFTPAIARNIFANIIGMEATEICSKTFFDVFVFMGGCGATMCLLFAILFFSKRRCNRSLSKIAFIPMIFNINEIMVFGLPIIFNLYMFIPFMFTPIICFLISYSAIFFGLVPVPVVEVTWTTPIILGGYLATNSPMGAILQILNLVVGIFIYMPFVKMYDKVIERKSQTYLKQLIEVLSESEETKEPVRLTSLHMEVGAMAKTLALDLQQAISAKKFQMYYQAQYNNKGECTGVEALLRWKHDVFGIIHPPLVIKLTEELNIVTEFERLILEKVFIDAPLLAMSIGKGAKISANVSVITLKSNGFEEFLKEQIKNIDTDEMSVCLEITEQMALKIDDDVQQLLSRIRQMGYKLAIDDFSMGHTSLKYLQTNQFDVVKLDGALVRGMQSNNRSKDIIASIVYLSQSMGFSVLAEFVETEEQRADLEAIGCLEYQGYLYGPAIPLPYFTAIMQGKRKS